MQLSKLAAPMIALILCAAIAVGIDSTVRFATIDG
jgi:hypothetical protein